MTERPSSRRPRHHKPLERTGLGNNYVLTVLFEDMARTIDREAFRQAAREMIERHRRDEPRR